MRKLVFWLSSMLFLLLVASISLISAKNLSSYDAAREANGYWKLSLRGSYCLYENSDSVPPLNVRTIDSCGVILNESGYYILTGNLSANGGNCIMISANNVTIDGNGYTILNPLIGITTYGEALHFNITIKNLKIYGADHCGISLPDLRDSIIENVEIYNSSGGIGFGGDTNGVILRNNRIHDCNAGISLFGKTFYSEITPCGTTSIVLRYLQTPLMTLTKVIQ